MQEGDSGCGGFWRCGQCFDQYVVLYDGIGCLCGDDASEVGEGWAQEGSPASDWLSRGFPRFV